MDEVTIGVIGAGNRGETHSEAYAEVPGATVAAVADVDEDAAQRLAERYDVPEVYADFRAMLDDSGVDAVDVCVHNNLHRPMAVAAFEAGKHVFCEKPLAGSYADAKAIADAAEAAGKHLGVQNETLLAPETRGAKTFVDEGNLGEISYARSVYSRRRGRPYVDGYGTPAFVSKESAGGGPVIDIGTYEIGRMLYLLDNPDVERVNGKTFEFYRDSYDESLVGPNTDVYEDRLEDSGFDVEDAGTGAARLADGTRLEIRAAWHMYQSDERGAVVGSTGGIELDPLEFHTTTNDYETTARIDVDEYETRQGRLASERGYTADRPTQFDHWIETVRGDVEPIPTGDIALNSMLVMEGIYLSDELGREVSADEVVDNSESRSVDL
ncbi:Predicted dehydrogenase [Halomicrobium zhouii]|uniref:Predicted dehydrogenase n=1 Tax=Halomicrobium zhouii TaxID=767519 RepID=A0A1I6MBZ9_9EURY|nr:Gfo/Idh/MocA family oxidoreductase [Halomicrobium zhouii]SFS13137.1 Predicted dehydrogenase [Halomicrobium zhouii]